jgi:hypothetical protein
LTEGGLIPFKIIAAKVGIESKYYGCYIPWSSFVGLASRTHSVPLYSLRSFIRLSFQKVQYAMALSTWRERVQPLGHYHDIVDGTVHRGGTINIQLILYVDGMCSNFRTYNNRCIS